MSFLHFSLWPMGPSHKLEGAASYV